jgi:pilus assembly protein CpaB
MIKNLAIGGRGNRLSLLAALFFGLLAAVLTVVYLSRAGGESGGGTSGEVATLPVVVAAQDIPAGTRIEADMVRLRSIPQSAVLSGAFQDTQEVIGKVTQVPLVAGEQVIQSKVTGGELALAQFGDNPPLSLLIPEGMRAVSVQVSSVVGAGGLIRPGDFVDVILSVEVGVFNENGETIGRNQVARTILQNVQVLAIDQEVVRSVPGEEGAPTPSGMADFNPEATTATLAVSPVHGEVLALADICRRNFSGQLILALRSYGDDSTVDTRSEWPEGGPPPDCASLLGLEALS